MTVFQAAIIGIVEGFTEFLPISSTGHLILTARLLGMRSDQFLSTFNIAIQLGAILAVVALYGKSLLTDLQVLKRVMTAFFPTAVIGLLFYKTIKTHLLNNDAVVLWALALGGVCLIAFELLHKESESPIDDLSKITYVKAIGIGLFQSLAIIPGVSRSAATILGGLILGVKRKSIVKFSFLVAVPTMAAATAWDLAKNYDQFTRRDALLLAIGGSVSFVVALISIRFLIQFVRRHTFITFGIYRIVVALVFWFWI
jgi:undecaprenyl-diphosphatase